MEFGFTIAAYAVAAVLFILSLGGLSGQESAKRAVWYGIAGMAIAVLATMIGPGQGLWWLSIILIAIGAVVGYQRSDDLALRTAAADRLLKRVVPELKSVEATTDHGVTFKIVSPFELPGSRRQKPDEVDGTIDYVQLEKLRDVSPTKTEDE